MNVNPTLSMPLTSNDVNLLQATPSPNEIRVTWIIMGVLMLGCLITIPFAAHQWPATHLLYAAAGIATFAEITTGLLLLSQALLLRQTAGLVLGLGYTVGGLVILINLLLAPDVSTRLWLFRLWHGVFVISVLLYSWPSVRNNTRLSRTVFRRWALRLSVLGFLFIALMISYLVGKPFKLPAIVHNGNYITIPDLLVNGIQLVIMVIAWVLLLTARRKTVLSIWMAVVACAVSIDIVLFVLGTTLFSAGLYISKLNNLLAGTMIFGVMFYRYIHIQAELQRRRLTLLRANRRLAQIALTDTLTKLPNRAALDQHIQTSLGRAERAGHRLAICLVDMDNFKSVNDQYGHEIGDKLLQAFAKRLTAVLRQEEFFARLGGDEFVLVLENLSDNGSLNAAMKRITNELSHPFVLSLTIVVDVTVSIGVALYPDRTTHRALLRAADQALYCAKAHKDARTQPWTVFNPENNKDDRSNSGEQAAHCSAQ